MGDRRSFRIESKRFDLVLGYVGRNQVRMSERSTFHRSMIYMSRDGARWLGRCVEENVVREGEKAFVRTLREHDKTFVSRRYSNKYGRYIEVLECGRGGSREWLVIPEGHKLNGWKGFSMELNLLLKPLPPNNPNHQVPTQKPHLLTAGEPTTGKGVVVAGGSKSYKEVVMDRKHDREVRVAPKKHVNKSVQSDGLLKTPMEEHLLSAVSSDGWSGEVVDQNKKGSNIPPKISATIKPRQPLRFSPDVSHVTSRDLGKGLTIHLNDKGQRSVVWTSTIKAQVKEQWVPHEQNAKSNFGLQGLMSKDREPVNLGLAVDMEVSRANYEERPSREMRGFGYNSTFEVGSSSSGYKEDHGLQGMLDGPEVDGFNLKEPGGFKLKEPGQHLKNGSTGHDKSSMELTAAPALEHGGVLSPVSGSRVDWVTGDAICRSTRWRFAEAPIKVRLYTVPFFSCFLDKEGLVEQLLGLTGRVVTSVGARDEFMGVTGLAIEIGSGDRDDDG
jgi:hypothetical protein